jgi:hypothetical protein
MDTNGDGDDGDVEVGDGYDAQSSLDPDGSDDRCPSLVPLQIPSGGEVFCES